MYSLNVNFLANKILTNTTYIPLSAIDMNMMCVVIVERFSVEQDDKAV